MPVRSMRGIKPIIWTPPRTDSQYKITVDRSDSTTDNITEEIILFEVEDAINRRIGRFKFELWDPNQNYKDVWTGMEVVKYYKDYAAEATTLRFRGRIEKVSYTDNKLRVVGRNESLHFMDITVTQQFNNIEASEILKSLNTSYGEGNFTSNNVNTSSTNMTVNWYQKPFFDCIQEITTATGFDCYVDSALDWHFFESGTDTNEDDALIHTYNILSVGDFAKDLSQIKNRVIVYGAVRDNIQIIYTAEDTTSQSDNFVREQIINDDNITTYAQAEEFGDFFLDQNKNAPTVGEVTGLMLAGIQPGQSIRVSSPDNNLPPAFYNVVNYKDVININRGQLTTTVTIQREPRIVSDVFKKIIELSYQKDQTSINPQEMRYSFNFLYDDDEGVHTDTEITKGVLRLQTGQASGSWLSPVRTLSTNLSQAYLILTGTLITGASVQVSGDGGVNFQDIINKQKIDITTAAGKTLQVKVTITDTTTEIDSLSLLYKLS